MTKYNYIKLLEDIGRKDVSKVGGKGANLGEMIYAGIPVPGGFVVLTGAYKKFLAANNLEMKIGELIIRLDENNTKQLEEASEKIKELFWAGDIPGDVLAEIDDIYRVLDNPTVAVRSSATAEDLPGTSFAGQYDTYLNVNGIEELNKSIKKCWASLWNSRALSYRLKQGIENKELAHGVVVQKLVSAEKSGILFTANPVNGRRDQMLLNSSWGLGEAIVGGEVSPDQWVVDKVNGNIIEEIIASKEVMVISKEKGIELVDVPKEKQEEVTLTGNEVTVLLKLGQMVESYFGEPQDIEWAFENARFYLVQTRPITSLYPLPKRIEGIEGLRIHVNMSIVSQGMQDPFTPMGENVFMKTMLIMAKTFDKRIKDEEDLWWCQSVGGRIFIDYTELLRNQKRWEAMIINDYFYDQDPLAAKVLLLWLEKNKKEITSSKSKLFPYLLRKIIPALKLAWPMASAMAYGSIYPLKAKEKALYKWSKTIEETRAGVRDLKGNEEKLAFIEERLDYFTKLGWSALSLITPSCGNLEKAEKMASPYLEDTSDFRQVEKSLPYNATTEMGMEMMRIAKIIDEEGEYPTLDHPLIVAFFDKYGHRSVEEVDIGIPRWDEDPDYALELIKSYIVNQTYNQGLDNFCRGAEEAEIAINRIAEKLRNAGKKRLAKRVEKLLKTYREVFGLREESKVTLTHIYSVVRRLLTEIGADLKSRGLLDEAMDIFFVRFKDIRSGEKLQETVQINREFYNRMKNLSAPRLLSSTGESLYAAAEKVEGALIGIPVSAGIYEGRARILYSPEESSSLGKGDILVTRGTNPAWTPIFLNLGAIVTESGGPISHGAIVAREYGIPAVVGVGEATSIIREGQKIRVNGETGQVELLD